MQCSEIRELLSEYIDDVLDEKEKSAIAEHIRTCSTCFQEMTDLQETVNLLHSLGEVSPPGEFRKQLRVKLEKLPPPVIKSSGTWLNMAARWFSGSKKYAAAAVIMISLGVSIGVYKLSQGELQSKGPTAALNSKNEEDRTSQEQQNNQVMRSKDSGQSPETPKVEGEPGVSIADSKAPVDTPKMFGAGGKNVSPGSESAAAGSGKALTPPEGLLPTKTPQANEPPSLRSSMVQDSGVKIIKRGYLNLEVNNYNEFATKLKDLTVRCGGWIENSSENSSQPLSANFTIRVPVGSFSELSGRIESLGKVTGRQYSDEDVTAEFKETESRLANLEQQEQALVNSINKARSLDEVLVLENEITGVREQMDALRGRLNYLGDASASSLLRLEVKG